MHWRLEFLSRVLFEASIEWRLIVSTPPNARTLPVSPRLHRIDLVFASFVCDDDVALRSSTLRHLHRPAGHSIKPIAFFVVGLLVLFFRIKTKDKSLEN